MKRLDYGQAHFLYVLALKLADTTLVAAVWYGCWYLRFDSNFFPVTKGLPSLADYTSVLAPLMLVYFSIFHIIGAYRKDRVHFGFRSLKKIFEGSALGLLVFIAVLYFANSFDFSRIYLLLFLALLIPSLVIQRLILAQIWGWFKRHLVSRIRVLAIGSGDLLEMYVDQMNRKKPYPMTWVGRLGEKISAGPLTQLNYLGGEERLAQLVENGSVDSIVISYPTDRITKYSDILETVSNELVGIKLIPDFGRYSTFAYTADHEQGIPILQFNKTPASNTDRVVKRLFDFFGALALIIFFAPVMVLVSLWIKLTSKGPILYKQERVGADGRTFNIYKFRSMRVDAEKETGAVWAVKEDTRTTALGKWLRKTSIDEFPQFFNVLRGDMSLVGPRPERPVFVSQFRREIPKYMLRHKVKSGITGWAQVNGWRGNTSLDERIKHDLYYIENWSHLFDFKILLMTLFKGFVNRHAY